MENGEYRMENVERRPILHSSFGILHYTSSAADFEPVAP